MRIGYPCINLTLDCKGDRTFRLKSYSQERLIDTIENNLNCLIKILEFNIKNNIYFFRLTSDLVPFASHPICQFNWQKYFQNKFQQIGDFIKKNRIRISMHPDQFIFLNSPDLKIFENSIEELYYHTQILDSMGLDNSAKIQIHIGGVYKDKEKSLRRFITRYYDIDENITQRLVIENDERQYSLKDCIKISDEIEIPVVFDTFHHELNNSGETIQDALKQTTKTWQDKDDVPIVDYSTQHRVKKRLGKHADSIDIVLFKQFLCMTEQFDFDIMLEIKDKEKSALKAIYVASDDKRLK